MRVATLRNGKRVVITEQLGITLYGQYESDYKLLQEKPGTAVIQLQWDAHTLINTDQNLDIMEFERPGKNEGAGF